MNKVRYFIRWDGKDKSGIVKGELEIPASMGEPVLAAAVMKELGNRILGACKNGKKNKKGNRNKTKNRKTNN